MEKMVRILALILVPIFAFLWMIFQTITPEPVQWESFQGDGYSCLVPAGPHSLTEDKGWHKNLFSATGPLYVSTRPREEDASNQIVSYSRYLSPAYEASIPVFENGRFYLEKKGKWRRYVYLFTAGDTFFWIENSSRGSTLRTFKDVLDEVVASMEVGGRRVRPEFQGRVDEINKAIRWYSQSEDLLLGLMMGIPAVIICVIAFVILPLIGKLPTFTGRRPVRTAQNLFAWVRKPLQINGTLVAIALFDDKFAVYIWKRPFIIVTKGDGTIAPVAGRERLVVRQGNRQATIDLEQTSRWLSELSSRGFKVVRH
jgi:hypothetical protein